MKSAFIPTFAALIVLVGASFGFSTVAHAVVVDFEDQPAGPNVFSKAGVAKTLIYNFGGGLTATFTGGVILTNEVGETTDLSNVYATCNICGGPSPLTLTNPLVVTFSRPIQNFQIDISNALAGNYEVYDNAGNTDFFSLATTGGSLQTVGFAATGTVVDIAYLDNPTSVYGEGNWDFTIDNVTFNQDTVGGNNTGTTPLPATLPLFASGLGALGLLGWRRKRKATALAS